MSFTKPGPAFGYVTGDLIDEDDINYWCTALPDCVDGAGGGTYALFAPLTFTGDIVTFEDVVVNDDLEVNGDFTAFGLAVIGSTSSDSLTIESNTEINGPVLMNGAFIMNATAEFVEPALFDNDVTLGNGSGGTDTITLNGTISPAIHGRILVPAVAVTSSTSVDVAVTRTIVATPASGGQTYTLSCTSVRNGDWFEIWNSSGGTSASIAGLVTQTLAASTYYKYVRIAGSWVNVVIA